MGGNGNGKVVWLQRIGLILSLLGAPSIGGVIWWASALASEQEHTKKKTEAIDRELEKLGEIADSQKELLHNQDKIDVRQQVSLENQQDQIKLLTNLYRESHVRRGAGSNEMSRLDDLVDTIGRLTEEVKRLNDQIQELEADNRRLRTSTASPETSP